MARKRLASGARGCFGFCQSFLALTMQMPREGVYLGFCESVLQQKTQGVDFGFCHSYKICENLRESVGTK